MMADLRPGCAAVAGRVACRAGALALAAVLATGGNLRAETAADLVEEGYQVAWGGYAGITTCLGQEDVYEIGPYLFVCGEATDAFPYHFGTVFLVARIYEEEGRRIVSTYLCLEDDADDRCFRGTVLRR